MVMMSFGIASAQPNAQGALLRSLIVPGWGQLYNQPESWTAGKIHLAADVALLAAYLGYDSRAAELNRTLITQARHYSGADLVGQSRSFRFAVADFASLAAYNDYQLRTRNWNRILADTPENQWQWQDDDSRRRYVSLINKEAAARDQLPAIASLMVVNRVLAGIGAYRQARNFTLTTGLDSGVPTMHLRVGF